MPARRKRKRAAKPKKQSGFDLARRLFEKGDLPGAGRACDKLLAKAPDDVNALHLAGLVARRSQRLDAALVHLEKAASIAPDHVGVLSALGMTRMDEGAPHQAAEAFRRAVEIDGKTLGLVFNLGVALEDSGDDEGAAAAYAQATQIDPQSERAHYNHARTLEVLGRTRDAEKAYRAALEIRPDYPKALNNLANIMRARTGPEREEALYLYEEANELEPGFAGAWCNRGLLLSDLGRKNEARTCFAKAFELDPKDATAEHMLAALSGDVRKTAPNAYVASLFDEYAESFDEHLTGELAYSVPEVLGDMLVARCGEMRGAGLDLGCGTGLFGARLRPLCKRLVGVDLSAKMVGIAKDKSIYDDAQVADIQSFLADSTEVFDIIAAADVFAYCGDLAPIFGAIKDRLAPAALFAFSTESVDDSDLVLRETGRFAHRREHVVALAESLGMELLEEKRIPVRSQHGDAILGDVMIFSVG